MVIYVFIAAVYIVTENRSPQSTFAWLFVFITLPILGIILYIFFGHGWRAFSQQNKIARQELGSDLMQDLGDLRRRQGEYVDRIAAEKPTSFQQKILRLTNQNYNSILTGYNDVEILQDASQKYPRLLADIKAAQHSIHLNYYIWTEDSFTLEVKEALIERAQAGVEVRCLYDTSGGTMSSQYLRDLTDNNVEIHPYLDYRYLTTLHTINYRSHRKMAVIDGKIGYVGGLNLDIEQIKPPAAFDAWRDTHLRLVGEAAWALQASFVVSWFNTTGQKVTGRQYYAPIKTKNFMPVQITQGGPDSQWNAIRQLYFLMIVSAENKIYLQSPFFVPDESLLEALKAAALAGLDVRLMCTPRGSTYQIPYRAANTYFQEVVEAGAKVYLYQAGYFHPKTLNIDNAVVTIGTANMDIRSFALNYETNAVVYDEGLAKQLEAQFLEDMKHCTEWTIEAYEKTSSVQRFIDSVYRLASPLL
ncbi:MAG: cardiolipin synthase [Anaerolineales bacterium]|nr:cardiolipin synthase [Anaerolineales bacterium]